MASVENTGCNEFDHAQPSSSAYRRGLTSVDPVVGEIIGEVENLASAAPVMVGQKREMHRDVPWRWRSQKYPLRLAEGALDYVGR